MSLENAGRVFDATMDEFFSRMQRDDTDIQVQGDMERLELSLIVRVRKGSK